MEGPSARRLMGDGEKIFPDIAAYIKTHIREQQDSQANVAVDIVLIVHPACSVPNTADVARTPGSSEARSAQKEPTLPKIPPCLATLLVQPRAVTPHRSIPQLQTMTPPTSLPTVITPPTETTPSSMPPPLPRTPQVKPYHLPLSFLPSSVLPRLGHCKRTSSELATHG
jgi:hypothetical protein